MATHPITLGRIAAPHGVQGWLKVDTFTETPESLLDQHTWCLRSASGDEQEFQLEDGQLYGRQLRVKFQGVGDRDAAAGLRGREVVVERAALPPVVRGEYYREDLIGLAVKNLQGITLGSVSHFVEGASVLMVVKGERERWLPAGKPCLRRVDLQAGELLVDWPEDF